MAPPRELQIKPGKASPTHNYKDNKRSAVLFLLWPNIVNQVPHILQSLQNLLKTTGWNMCTSSLSVSCICEARKTQTSYWMERVYQFSPNKQFSFNRIWHINASTQQSFPVSHFQCSRMLFTPLQAGEGMRSFLLHCLYLPPFFNLTVFLPGSLQLPPLKNKTRQH